MVSVGSKLSLALRTISSVPPKCLLRRTVTYIGYPFLRKYIWGVFNHAPQRCFLLSSSSMQETLVYHRCFLHDITLLSRTSELRSCATLYGELTEANCFSMC